MAEQALEGERIGRGVLCHGVLIYLDDPAPLVDALCTLAEPGGTVSIGAKNTEVMAIRRALEGDWAAALAAFDRDRQINGLCVDTRGDNILIAGKPRPGRPCWSLRFEGVSLAAESLVTQRADAPPCVVRRT
jgi:S-adenosylmethionine-dependent methyltransferase